MTVGEAYRVLELEPGATEAAVRDARKLLAKVWHPDRHASDPALQAVAEKKLGLINAAFETLRDAGYPPAPRPRAPSQPPPPKFEKVAPPPIELVTRRRVRAWVIVVFALALGAGAYLAIMQLGSNDDRPVAVREPTKPGPVIIPHRDPLLVTPLQPAPAPDPQPTPPAPLTQPDPSARPDPRATRSHPEGTFTLGSTRDEVRAVQGAPEGVTNVIDERWDYGFGASVTFHDGAVTGWDEMDQRLHISLQPLDPDVAAAAKQRGHWTIGSTKDEVLALQGTPHGIWTVQHDKWFYGFGSTVDFDAHGRVTGYDIFDGTLEVGK